MIRQEGWLLAKEFKLGWAIEGSDESGQFFCGPEGKGRVQGISEGFFGELYFFHTSCTGVVEEFAVAVCK